MSVRIVIRTACLLAMLGGLALLGVVAWQTWGTDIGAGRQQQQVSDDLREGWTDGGVEVVPRSGDGFVCLHVPRLGADWVKAVVEGTAEDTLLAGPGHFTGTAMPGELGNFAMAGHRVGGGAYFNDLDELVPGDPVVVETADSWFVYRVTGSAIVSPETVEVVYPVPGGTLDDVPDLAVLTMTTCNPEFSNKERLVVHALLESSVSKAEAPQGPAALTERV